MKAGLAKAEALCAEGGDWERKNKLKVGLRSNCMQSVAIRSQPHCYEVAAVFQC